MTNSTNHVRRWRIGVVAACCGFGIQTSHAGTFTGSYVSSLGSSPVQVIGSFGPTASVGAMNGGASNAGIVISAPVPAHASGNSAYVFDGNWGKPLGHDFYDGGNLRASLTYYGAAGRGGSVQAVGLSLSLLSN